MIYDAFSKLTRKTITEPADIILQGFTSGDSGAMTGLLVSIDTVYSITEGTVISVDRDFDGLWVVTVMYAPDKLIRYCLLDSTSLALGTRVIPTDKIGTAHRGKLRLEYCTTEKSQFPVRISDTTYYKQDPMIIMDGSAQLYMSVPTAVALSNMANPTTATTPTNPKVVDNLSSILSGS